MAARISASRLPTRTSARARRVDNPRREQLLRELEELLLTEGFTALTVDEIARRLRCSKATLYSLAGTKEQLVILVVKHFFGQAAEAVEQVVAAETDPGARVAAYLGGIGGEMRRNSVVFYEDMLSYPPTAEIYGNNAATAAARVQELIGEGVEAGAFRPVDGRFAGELVAMAIDSVLSGALLETTELTAGEAFAEIGDLILYGLTRHDQRPARRRRSSTNLVN